MTTKPSKRYQAEPVFDQYGLSLKPQNINATNWYYEEKGGIDVIHEVRDRGSNDYVRTDTIRIPWRKLEASLKRWNRRAR